MCEYAKETFSLSLLCWCVFYLLFAGGLVREYMNGCLDFFHWLVVAVSRAILLASIEPQSGGNSIGSVSILNGIPAVMVLGYWTVH